MKLIVIGGTDNQCMEKEVKQLRLAGQNPEVAWYPERGALTAHFGLDPSPQKKQYETGFRMVDAALKQPNSSFVIVVTHSDHVLNGIRVAIRQGKIPHQEVEVRFCQPDEVTIVIRLDKNGRLGWWPEGCFDQWERALLELLEEV